MSTVKQYDPNIIFNKFNNLWEKQINDCISLLSGHRDTLEFSKRLTESQTSILDLFRKNQEVFASMLNIPTKNDVTNIAEQNLATEGKIEILEEQILSLQDSIQTSNKDIENMVKVSKQMIKLTKQLKAELLRTKKELAKRDEFQTHLQSMNQELAQLTSFKEEFEIVKSLIDKGEQKEQVLAGSGQSK